MDIIGQLLNISAEKYLRFEESCEKYIQTNSDAIAATHQRDDNVIALLFRNVHTIKGNCRTYGFKYLSDVVHEVESSYSLLKSSPKISWNPTKIMNDLVLVKTGLAEYAHVYRSVLGRGKEAANRLAGFWINHSTIETIRDHIQNNEINQLKVFVSQLNTISIEHNLSDVIASLDSIASQLDKKTPTVTIVANGIFIKDSAQELIKDIFSHILRNCVDHGLESTAQRVNAGKNASGSILINAQVQKNQLHISVQDDGNGLNMNALFEKGKQLGKWQTNDTPRAEEVAQLIFDSGISTKTTVTDISGRGVGMDAVKQFLSAQGGDIFLKLHTEQPSIEGYVKFELIVSLPPTAFFEMPADDVLKST